MIHSGVKHSECATAGHTDLYTYCHTSVSSLDLSYQLQINISEWLLDIST